MLFRDIIGQDKLKMRLIQSVKSNRVSHAFLVSGALGYGSLPLVLAFVRYIHCTNKTDLDSCGSCSSCLKFSKYAHPDVHFSFPVNSNKSTSSKPLSKDFIQEWRNIIQENPYLELSEWQNAMDIGNKQLLINVAESQELIKKLSLKPYESDYKTLIIWKAEKLNPEASNKLLKLIEEPTDKTIIFLIVENPDEILPTILSRCHNISLKPIDDQALTNHLIQNHHLNETDANSIVDKAYGNYNLAKNFIKSSEERVYFFECFKDWMRNCYEADVEKMNKWVDEITSASNGRETQKRFLNYCLEIIREGMLINFNAKAVDSNHNQELAFLLKFAPFVHENNVIPMMELIDEAHLHISRNANGKIVFMDMSMQFANLLHAKKRTFVS